MHIAGKNRLQIEMSCLEDRITAENPVRVIDAFIDALDLEKLGFGSSIPEYFCYLMPCFSHEVVSPDVRTYCPRSDLHSLLCRCKFAVCLCVGKINS